LFPVREKQVVFQRQCNKQLEDMLNTQSIYELMTYFVADIVDGDSKDVSKRKFTEITTFDDDNKTGTELLSSQKLAKYFDLKCKKLDNLLEVKSNNKYLIHQALLKVSREIYAEQEIDLKTESIRFRFLICYLISFHLIHFFCN
jgi:hypothetical protein